MNKAGLLRQLWYVFSKSMLKDKRNRGEYRLAYFIQAVCFVEVRPQVRLRF